MLKSSVGSVIRLRGVRHNNLKNFDLDLPLHQLIVITGLSGSGKSSLAFDTLFAEGQRRYIETFSPYARQFFDRMDKPQVDGIEGIPPAIAIEQRNAVKTTRSTVGTMTEICDYMKMLWPHVAQLHCRNCGRPVRKDSPQQIWRALTAGPDAGSATSSEDNARDAGREEPPEVLVTFDVPLSDKLSMEESLALIAKQGYQRLLAGNEILRLDEAASRFRSHVSHATPLTVIQDRIRLVGSNRPRFVEACEQAYHFGKGKLAVRGMAPERPKTETKADGENGRGRGGSALGVTAPRLFSNRLHCAQCDIEYQEPTPALFSFNHPVGACPACKGFGRIISIDYHLALPDRSLTLQEGVVRPWRNGFSAECQQDLARFCRRRRVPMDVPFAKLPEEQQRWVLEGDPDYGTDREHEWPNAWYGVKGYFRWLESKAYKMHVRVLLSRYRAYTPCPSCGGARFQPETLLYQLKVSDLKSPINRKQKGMTLADFYGLPIRDALHVVGQIAAGQSAHSSDPAGLVVNEVRSRLAFLAEVGLGYLTLDRPTRSLSGGETERVNLTTCLGTRLVNTLFVLDEPSVGLHPRDTQRLVRTLEQLRDAGNTVVVVEHEASVMRAADQIVDLGPGHGATGGQVVFQGGYREILRSGSITGQYLSGQRKVAIPMRRVCNLGQASRLPNLPRGDEEIEGAMALKDAIMPIGGRQDACPALKLTHATRHNLKDLSVEIPLGRFVCVTGVSGSGKTTLVREVLLPALEANLKSQISNLKFKTAKASERFDHPVHGRAGGAVDEDEHSENGEAPSDGARFATQLAGAEHLGRVVLVDQSILGKTPRSNPAVYIGAFDDIREFLAQSDAAKQRGLNASAFSFNSPQGQCERCRGAGFEKIEMQFLSDVFIRCPDCDGRRYRPHILEVKVPTPTGHGEAGTNPAASHRRRSRTSEPASVSSLRGHPAWSIADFLDATVDEVIDFLTKFSDSRPAQRAIQSLGLLREVGLGYLRLGQPINTLSGGESQRLKLVRHLAESRVGASSTPPAANPASGEVRPTLFLFDEPTTGLHFDDVRVLLGVFQRLVDAGHSVLVIEHNLDVIKCADWLIDLGPDAGDEGGRIVAQGTPEAVAACAQSHTGRFLRELAGIRSSDTTDWRAGRSRSSKQRRTRVTEPE